MDGPKDCHTDWVSQIEKGKYHMMILIVEPNKIIIQVKVKLLAAQSCPTLCNPMDCSLPVSSVHGILQARILEWVAIPFSRGSSSRRGWTHSSCTGGQILYLLSHLESSHIATFKKGGVGNSFLNWSYNDRKLPCPVRNKEKHFRLWTERIFLKNQKKSTSPGNP